MNIYIYIYIYITIHKLLLLAEINPIRRQQHARRVAEEVAEDAQTYGCRRAADG